MRFSGETALVTGAGKGFGRAIALKLASDGAKVALIARTKSDIEALADEIRAHGGTALAIPVAADVTNEADVARSIRETEAALGPITQFVNNAGVGWPYGPVGGMDVARWWEAQQLHQLAPMLYLSRLLPRMSAARRGRVVIVSAKASHLSVGGMSAYITGKTAQVRIVNVAALEVKDAGVSLFAIDPGFVVTNLARETMTNPEAKQHLAGMVERLSAVQDKDFSAELAACANRVADLLSGKYDALTGGYFEIPDDIDAALAAKLEEASA